MLSVGSALELNHGTRKVPWFTLSVGGGVLSLYLLGSAFFQTLIFDKQLIMAGEIWRILTGHLVHSSFDHLLWDLLGFLILGIVIERNNTSDLIPGFLFSCLGVSGWLLMNHFGFLAYCGLSGALNGLLVIAAVNRWRTTNSFVYGGVLFGTAMKIIFELTTRHSVFTNMSAQAVPEAHAAGFCAGLVYLLGVHLFKRGKRYD